MALAPLVFGMACGGAEVTGVMTSGTFVLRRVDGGALPATVSGGLLPADFTIIADTLVLDPRGTFNQWSVPASGTPTLGMAGTYAVRGDSVFLAEIVLGTAAASGTIAGNTIRLRSTQSHLFPNHDWEYQRAGG